VLEVSSAVVIDNGTGLPLTSSTLVLESKHSLFFFLNRVSNWRQTNEVENCWLTTKHNLLVGWLFVWMDLYKT
jgi:hypothetical protein